MSDSGFNFNIEGQLGLTQNRILKIKNGEI